MAQFTQNPTCLPLLAGPLWLCLLVLVGFVTPPSVILPAPDTSTMQPRALRATMMDGMPGAPVVKIPRAARSLGSNNADQRSMGNSDSSDLLQGQPSSKDSSPKSNGQNDHSDHGVMQKNGTTNQANKALALPRHECVDDRRVELDWWNETCVTAGMLEDVEDIRFYQFCGAEAMLFKTKNFKKFRATQEDSLIDTVTNILSSLPMVIASCLMCNSLHVFFSTADDEKAAKDEETKSILASEVENNMTGQGGEDDDKVVPGKAPEERTWKKCCFYLRNAFLLLLLFNTIYMAFITSKRFIQTVAELISGLHFGGWCNLILYCGHVSYTDTVKVMTLAAFSVADAVFVGLKLLHDIGVCCPTFICFYLLGCREMFCLVCCCKCWKFCSCPCFCKALFCFGPMVILASLLPAIATTYNIVAIVLVCGFYGIIICAVIFVVTMILYIAILPIGLVRKAATGKDFLGLKAYVEKFYIELTVQIYEDVVSKLTAFFKPDADAVVEAADNIVKEVKEAVQSKAKFLTWTVKSKYFVMYIPLVIQTTTLLSNVTSSMLTVIGSRTYADQDVYKELLIKSGVEEPNFGTKPFETFKQGFAGTSQFLYTGFVKWPTSVPSALIKTIAYYTDLEVLKKLFKEKALDYLDGIFKYKEPIGELEQSVFFLRGFNGFWSGPIELLDKVQKSIG